MLFTSGVRFHSLCLCAALIGSIQGCASFNLHDPAREMQAASAKDALGAGKI